MITENNTTSTVSNNELQTPINKQQEEYKNLVSVINTYAPEADVEKICIHRTEKGNWAVYDENHKKITLVSRYKLSDETVAFYNIQICEPIVRTIPEIVEPEAINEIK